MAKAPQFSRELAEVRRRELIDAARASLAARGLGAASVRDVAARAGVSPGLIRHHFGSFDALLAEAYRHVVARIDLGIDAAIAAAGRAGIDHQIAEVLINEIPRARLHRLQPLQHSGRRA